MPSEMNADLRDRIAKHLAVSDGLAWFLLADAEVEKYRKYSEIAIREMLKWEEEVSIELSTSTGDSAGIAKSVRKDFFRILKREAGL